MNNLMGELASITQTRKSRLKTLAQQLAAMEASASRAAPITIIRCRKCSHEECGQHLPSQLPADALIIWQGCIQEVPISAEHQSIELLACG
jgi:hypothetical protein